jgi:molybdate transport system substrate-binding protein
MARFIRLAAAIVAAVALAMPAPIAGAAEIKVLSTTAMNTTLDAVRPPFERTGGHTISVTYASSGQIAKRVAAGEAVDVVIVTSQAAERLLKQGHAAAGSRTDIARSAIGLAVQQHRPKPDISSVAAFRQTLLAAKSIALSTGEVSTHIAKVLADLGIAEALKPRITYGKGGAEDLIGFYLVRGEAEVGIHQMPALMAVPGINVVGPLPNEIQAINVFTAVLPVAAKNAGAARALIDFLKSPDASAVIKAKGMEPG